MFKRSLKPLLWWFLERLPVGLVKQVLQTIDGPDYINTTLWNGRRSLATELQLDRIISAGKTSSWKGVLLIGGPARIGKSIVAERVAGKLGAFVVPMDQLRKFYDVPDDNERQRIKAYMLSQLCDKGQGIVIEGDELITYRKFKFSEKIEDIEITPEILLELKETFGVIGITLGAGEEQAEERIQGIIRSGEGGNCWATNKLKKDQIRELTQLIIKLSHRLEIQSNLNKIPHYKTLSRTFENSIAEVCESIVNNVLSKEHTH